MAITGDYLEQFEQLLSGPVWDGDLISKIRRDCFVMCGYVTRTKGYNVITAEGVEVACNLGFLRP